MRGKCVLPSLVLREASRFGTWVLPSPCDWRRCRPRPGVRGVPCAWPVTPLRSELACAPGEEPTPVSASVPAATGCAWRGRAGVPAKPGARRDTEKAKEKLFCEHRPLNILQAEVDPGRIRHGKTMMTTVRSSARAHGPLLDALCMSLPVVLTPFEVGPDVASLCT